VHHQPNQNDFIKSIQWKSKGFIVELYMIILKLANELKNNLVLFRRSCTQIHLPFTNDIKMVKDAVNNLTIVNSSLPCIDNGAYAVAWTGANLNIGWRRNQSEYRKLVIFNTNRDSIMQLEDGEGESLKTFKGADLCANLEWEYAGDAMEKNNMQGIGMIRDNLGEWDDDDLEYFNFFIDGYETGYPWEESCPIYFQEVSGGE